jgi:hypothetical protein
MKAGDLIYWHGRNSIALVIEIDAEPNEHAEAWWVCLLEAGDDMITHDGLEEGFIVIDDDWDWPEWHINHRDNI